MLIQPTSLSVRILQCKPIAGGLKAARQEARKVKEFPPIESAHNIRQDSECAISCSAHISARRWAEYLCRRKFFSRVVEASLVLNVRYACLLTNKWSCHIACYTPSLKTSHMGNAYKGNDYKGNTAGCKVRSRGTNQKLVHTVKAYNGACYGTYCGACALCRSMQEHLRIAKIRNYHLCIIRYSVHCLALVCGEEETTVLQMFAVLTGVICCIDGCELLHLPLVFKVHN